MTLQTIPPTHSHPLPPCSSPSTSPPATVTRVNHHLCTTCDQGHSTSSIPVTSVLIVSFVILAKVPNRHRISCRDPPELRLDQAVCSVRCRFRSLVNCNTLTQLRLRWRSEPCHQPLLCPERPACSAVRHGRSRHSRCVSPSYANATVVNVEFVFEHIGFILYAGTRRHCSMSVCLAPQISPPSSPPLRRQRSRSIRCPHLQTLTFGGSITHS